MKNVKPIGRFIENNDGFFKFFWTGSGVDFYTYSSSLLIEIEAVYSAQEIWIIAELNGAVLLRQMLLPGLNKIPVYINLNPTDKKRIRILRDSQADLNNGPNYFIVKNITDINGNNIKTEAVSKKNISIEFIGDSITSGEGLKGSKNDFDFAQCFISFEKSYSKLIADYFDADFSIISQCGYGIKCGWNNDPDMTIPSVYKFTDGQQIEHDFSTSDFDFIIMNLGTNDNGAFEQEKFIKDDKEYMITEEDFISEGIHFVNYCLSKNPRAHILFVTGFYPLHLEREIKTIIKSCAEPNRISFHKVGAASDYDFGSRQHPGEKTHQKAAEILVHNIEKMLEG